MGLSGSDDLSAAYLARAVLSPERYVLVAIPRRLESSARLAVAGLYQPFFVEVGEEDLVVVAPEHEWERVAYRFPGAPIRRGYRLISLPVAAGPAGATSDPAPDVGTLVQWLADRGVEARILRSFFRDHLLLAEGDLPHYERLLKVSHPQPNAG